MAVRLKMQSYRQPLAEADWVVIDIRGVSMVKGSCLCGNIRYEVEIIPEQVFNCHCKFCRKAHGADYTTVAVAKYSTFKLIDEKYR